MFVKFVMASFASNEFILNYYDCILDFVLHNNSCPVNKALGALVPEDRQHAAFEITMSVKSQMNYKSNSNLSYKNCCNFRKANLPFI